MKKRKDKYGRVLKEGESLRSDGRYQYRYNTIDHKRKAVYAKTLDELRVKEREIQNNLYNGLCNTDQNITVDQMFMRCTANRQFLKPRSREVYEYSYNKHAKPVIGSRRIRDIKYSDMMIFFKYLFEEQNLGISGMRSVNHALKPVFRTAMRDNIIRTNPIDGVFAEVKKIYDLKENKRTAVSKEQLKALISFISSSPKDYKYFNIFCTLTFTGMRVSEMCALMWKDIDFENNVIHINRSIAYTKDGKANHIRLIQAPKTSSGIRTIPMFTGLKNILSEQKLLQENMPLVSCGEYSGFVFGNKNSLPYTADQIERILRNIVKHYNKYETEQAENENRKPLLIDSCTPHQLRLSFCTILCENDVNVKIIQEVMGHASVSTSLNIYAEISENKKQKELSRIEENFIQLNPVCRHHADTNLCRIYNKI